MHVSERLKQLRERAGMSKTELAKALGYKYLGGYHFEDPDRKADFLPVPTVVRLIEIMKPYGIPAGEILELAGFPNDVLRSIDDTPPDTLNADYVRLTVSAVQEFLIEGGISMGADAMGDIVVKFCSVYQSEVEHGREHKNLTKDKVKSILRFWTISTMD